jgi:hypothetical protein
MRMLQQLADSLLGPLANQGKFGRQTALAGLLGLLGTC